MLYMILKSHKVPGSVVVGEYGKQSYNTSLKLVYIFETFFSMLFFLFKERITYFLGERLL